MLLVNGKRIVPAPFVTINQQTNLTADGRSLGSVYAISLQGTLLPSMGSPNTTGWHTSTTTDPGLQTDLISTESRHEALLKKQELLRELFSYTDSSGVYLTYFSSGYSTVPIEAFCRPKGLTFNPSTWVQSIDYNIELDTMYINKVSTSGVNDLFQLSSSGYGLRNVQDSWQISQREDDSARFNISRTVSAQADTIYDANGVVGGEAWKNARAWVLGRVSGYRMEDNSFGLPAGISGYANLIQEESIDKLAGSYSVVQRYSYGASLVTDTRSVQRNITYRTLNDNSSIQVENITVNGVIAGFPTGSVNFDGSGAVATAYAHWNSIKNLIGPSVGAFGTGISLNFTEDYSNGTLSYTLAFVNNSGSTYRHTYDVGYTASTDGFPVVTINGTVEGITLDGFAGVGGTNTLRMNSATSGWRDDIKPNLKSLAFAYSNGSIFPTGVTSSNFHNVPLNQSVSFNPANGTITYNAAFGYLDSGSASDLYRNEYNINFNSANLVGTAGGYLVTATIEGQILGLSSGDASQRLTNATNAFSTIQNGLYDIASGALSNYFSSVPGLIARPVNKSIVVNTPGGFIQYSYTYSNALAASGTNVAVAEVSVDEAFPTQVIAVQQIPGRSIGPITQNLGTVTESRRNINISLIMTQKTGGTGRWDFTDRVTARNAASGYLNYAMTDWGVYNTDWYLVGENFNWDWKNGVYNGTYQTLKASGG